MTTDLIARAEAALTTIERLRKYDWQDWAAVDVEDAAQIVAGVPALIARIRELEAQNRELALDVLATSGQAQEAYEAQLAAEATVATLTAQVEAMRGALEWQESQRRDAFGRRYLNAPEDPHVYVLCKRYGFGAVMDAASRLWAREDSMGAFYIGGCIGIKPAAALTTENQTNG